MAQQALLDTIKSVFFWQRVVLFFWTIALIRRIYNLYYFAQYVFNVEGSELFTEFTFRIVIQMIQLVIYAIMVRETFNLTAHIKAYTADNTKQKFAIMVHSQQKIWKYLGVTFGIGVLMVLYYGIADYFL